MRPPRRPPPSGTPPPAKRSPPPPEPTNPQWWSRRCGCWAGRFGLDLRRGRAGGLGRRPGKTALEWSPPQVPSPQGSQIASPPLPSTTHSGRARWGVSLIPQPWAQTLSPGARGGHPASRRPPASLPSRASLGAGPLTPRSLHREPPPRAPTSTTACGGQGEGAGTASVLIPRRARAARGAGGKQTAPGRRDTAPGRSPDGREHAHHGAGTLQFAKGWKEECFCISQILLRLTSVLSLSPKNTNNHQSITQRKAAPEQGRWWRPRDGK